MARQSIVSDTVSVTHDGRTVVDIKKLLGKPHIQEMMREMREKTVIVPPRRKNNGEQKPESTD